MKYEPIVVKSKILNIYKHVDSWFWINGSINPYRGCEHNCLYCDGKAESYGIPNFGTHIKIKTNAAEILRKDLNKLGYRPLISSKSNILDYYIADNADSTKLQTIHKRPPLNFAVGGGVCDVYQPAEKKFKVTRSILKVFLEYKLPILILTKSNLILRDIDLIKKFVEDSHANIAFSITLMDEKIQKLIEPKSSSTSERFEALKTLKELGCTCGVMAMPLIPGIGDSKDNIEQITKKSAEIGLDYILFSGMTLKPGRNQDEFLSFINGNFPHLNELYKSLYAKSSKYGEPAQIEYPGSDFMVYAHKMSRKYGISDRMPRFIPDGSNTTNLKVSEVLQNIIHLRKWIYNENWFQLKTYFEASKLLEATPNDIADYSVDDLGRKMKLGPQISHLINEIARAENPKIFLNNYENDYIKRHNL